MKAPMSYMPMLPLALGLMGGILLGRILPDGISYIIVAASVTTIVLGWRRRWMLCAAAAAVGCGAVLISAHHVVGMRHPDESPTKYKGTVIEVIERESSRSMVVDVRGLPYNVYITTPTFNPEFLAGDYISFSTELQPLDGDPEIEDMPHMGEYYYIHRVGATGFVVPRDLDNINGDRMSTRQWLEHWRHAWVGRIMRSDMDAGASQLLAATFLGERGAMDRSEVSRFRDAGAAHLLALSGLHAALVWLVISIALWPLRHAGWGTAVKVVAIALLWSYVVLTGLTPSVIRAAVMVTLVAIGEMIGRRGSAPNALCVAAIVILLISPEALFDVGFQLSFIAVVGIVIWGAWFGTLDIRQRWLRALIGAAGVAMSAMMATSMITAFYFHKLPLLFLLVNIPLALLFPLFLGVGMIWSLIVLTGFSVGPLIWIINILYRMMAWIVDGVAAADGATLDNIYITPWAILPWMAAIVILGCWVYYRRRVWGWALALCVVCAGALVALTPRVNRREMVIASRGDNTMIMVNDGNMCRAFVIGLPQDSAFNNEYWGRQLSGYAGNRRLGVPQVGALPTPLIDIGGTRWLIVNDDDYIPMPCDAILICKGYLGGADQVVELIDLTGATRVYLSGDLNRRVDKRLTRQFSRVPSIEVMSLREKALRLSISPDKAE